MLDDRAEGVRGQKRQRTDDEYRTDEQRYENRRIGRERSRSFGDGFLSGERSRKFENRDHLRKTPEEHVRSGRDIVKQTWTEPTESAAVVRIRRRERVQNLREAVGAIVTERRQSRRNDDSYGCRHQHEQRRHEDRKHREGYFAPLDLLAQELRRTADHETGNEHRQNHEHQLRVQAASHAAEND